MDQRDRIILATGIMAMLGIVALYSMKPKVSYLVMSIPVNADAPVREEAK